MTLRLEDSYVFSTEAAFYIEFIASLQEPNTLHIATHCILEQGTCDMLQVLLIDPDSDNAIETNNALHL